MANAVPSLGRPAPAIRDLSGTPMPVMSTFGDSAGWITSISQSLWFTPGQPVAPQAPAGTPIRSIDFPVGINIMYVPRSEEDITFAQLRQFASGIWDLLRIAIESKKSQLCGIDWTIRPVKQPGESAGDYKARAKDPAVVNEAEEIRQIFLRPNGVDTFSAWLRAVLEDLIVIDAMCITKGTRAGRTTLEWVDGATIKRLLDVKGNTPEPTDGVAYQQVVKGVPADSYSTDELFYRRRNILPNKIYGLSPVEQIAWTINFAIRRQIFKMSYYTEGNIPEAFILLPADWGLDAIKTYAEWFDSRTAGQVDIRRRAFFLPGVSGKDSVIPMKQDALKDEMEEWLARVVRDALDLSAQPYVREMNRATAGTAQEATRNEGIVPWLKFLNEVLTDLVQDPKVGLGHKAFEFQFSDEQEFDQLKKAQRQALQVRNGIKAIDEVREENGDETIGVGPGIVTMNGFVEIDTAVAQTEAELDNTKNPPAPAQAGSFGGGSSTTPSDGADSKGKGATGAGQAGGNVQKVTAADAWRSNRGRRRRKRFEDALETYLARQGDALARQLGSAYDQRRASKASGVMDFVDEATEGVLTK